MACGSAAALPGLPCCIVRGGISHLFPSPNPVCWARAAPLRWLLAPSAPQAQKGQLSWELPCLKIKGTEAPTGRGIWVWGRALEGRGLPRAGDPNYFSSSVSTQDSQALWLHTSVLWLGDVVLGAKACCSACFTPTSYTVQDCRPAAETKRRLKPPSRRCGLPAGTAQHQAVYVTGAGILSTISAACSMGAAVLGSRPSRANGRRKERKKEQNSNLEIELQAQARCGPHH